jgi:hypothetical protein
MAARLPNTIGVQPSQAFSHNLRVHHSALAGNLVDRLTEHGAQQIRFMTAQRFAMLKVLSDSQARRFPNPDDHHYVDGQRQPLDCPIDSRPLAV